MGQKTRVAATGLSGLIGSRIVELLNDEFNFIPLSIEKMNITDRAQVFSVLEDLDFDIFLHLAAYTDVDQAEKEKKTAEAINVKGTENVFKAVSQRNKNFIYISTDFVFDGKKPPFFESSLPNPISYYGLTKYQGEKIVKDKAMIVRLSYPYRASYQLKKDFVRTIHHILSQGEKIKGVADQIVTFTFIDDIAYALRHLLHNFSPQIYHVVGADSLSAYDGILTICEVFGFDKSRVEKTTYEEFYRGRAKRPKKGIIKSKKNDFHQMMSFKQGLQQVKMQFV